MIEVEFLIKDKVEKHSLEDKDALLIIAIQELTKAIKYIGKQR